MSHLPGFTATAALEHGITPTWRAKLLREQPQVIPQRPPCDACDLICERYGYDSRRCISCQDNCL